MTKKYLSLYCGIVGILLIAGSLIYHLVKPRQPITGAPPYGVAEDEVPQISISDIIRNWVRPEGPPKVGLQVGHWKNQDVPTELENLKRNTGAFGGGKMEWEVNYAIASEAAKVLEAYGVQVDVLPATVPPRYWADVFIAIHADGNEDPRKSGYKFSGPWRDLTGKAESLVSLLEQKYEAATGLEKDPNITRNMRGYYAFSWWKNVHAIHPMTTGVIAETGFLTSKADQKLLINNPHISGRAIAEAIVEHLTREGLLKRT